MIKNKDLHTKELKELEKMLKERRVYIGKMNKKLSDKWKKIKNIPSNIEGKELFICNKGEK